MQVSQQDDFISHAVIGHKKSVKKSWTALGVSVKVADDATTRANAPVTAAEAVKPVKASSKKPAEKAKPSAGTKETKPAVEVQPKPAVSLATKPVTNKNQPIVGGKPVKRTQKEEAAHLLDIYTKNPDKINARHLVEFKKAAKKSWKVLGVDDKLGKRLEERVKP